MAKQDIQLGLLVSLTFHVVIACLFIFKVLFFPSEPIKFRGAVKVDMIDLPDLMPKTPPKHTSKKATKVKAISTPQKKTGKVAETKAPKVPLEKSKEKVRDRKKTESKAQAALRKLKAQAAIDKLKKSVKKRETPKEKSPGPSKEIKYAGNILSPGTELTGLTAVQMDNFIVSIDKHVKKNWILPQWMSQRPDLKARVVVTLDEKGFLRSAKLVSSSKDPRYDDIVLQTVRKSDPFPAPPPKFKDIVAVNGIELGFPE